MGTFVYEMPGEKERLIDFLWLIPPDWSWIDASLFATDDKYEARLVEEKCRLNHYGDKQSPTICFSDDFSFERENLFRKRVLSEVRGVKKVERELFSSIVLSYVGLYRDKFPEIDIQFAKRLLAGSIYAGYKGEVTALKRIRTEKEYAKRLKISHFEDHIILEWRECFGGKKEDLEWAIKGLERLGIKRQTLKTP
jgi:hypothetical protein